MPYMSVSPDQLASAGSYVAREWGDYGYRFTGIESPASHVSVFRVQASDGSRFTVLVDRWSNCRHLDTHNGDEGLGLMIAEMQANATAP